MGFKLQYTFLSCVLNNLKCIQIVLGCAYYYHWPDCDCLASSIRTHEALLITNIHNSHNINYVHYFMTLNVQITTSSICCWPLIFVDQFQLNNNFNFMMNFTIILDSNFIPQKNFLGGHLTLMRPILKVDMPFLKHCDNSFIHWLKINWASVVNSRICKRRGILF